MFELDIMPEEKCFCLFNPVFIQELDLCYETSLLLPSIFTGKAPWGNEYVGLRKSIQFQPLFIFNRKKSFHCEDQLSFKFYLIPLPSFYILRFILFFLEMLY